MTQKILFLVKTGIFYEFSKWWKIEILKPLTKPQNLLKGNGLSVICDLKPGLRASLRAFRVVTSIRVGQNQNNAERCVVFSCSNVRSKEKGILLHPIPFYGKSEFEKEKVDRFCKIKTCSLGTHQAFGSVL